MRPSLDEVVVLHIEGEDQIAIGRGGSWPYIVGGHRISMGQAPPIEGDKAVLLAGIGLIEDQGFLIGLGREAKEPATCDIVSLMDGAAGMEAIPIAEIFTAKPCSAVNGRYQ